MDIEHATKVFQLDDNLETNIRAMSAEGWLMMPGIAPVAIYHVVRMKGAQPEEGDPKPIARIAIDETKVKILRNGQLIEN